MAKTTTKKAAQSVVAKAKSIRAGLSEAAAHPTDTGEIPSSPPPTCFLKNLGIIGAQRLDAVVLASLATEAPLLLIGAHGTAKSLLLTRLAEALDLRFRHYNASLLNYDDLVGYPIPDAQGTLKFVETPASIWNAEVVFLDEISRCRSDMQNKCFPIIHEKHVQGMPLTHLKHRWAAMNPPPSQRDGTADDFEYVGSEALDVALADRFTFVVEMPDWRQFSESDRLALIRLRVEPLQGDSKDFVRGMVECTRERLAVVAEAFAEFLCEYVHQMSKELAAHGIHFSARRALMLRDAISAVHAARWTLGAEMKIDESAWIALKNVIPDRAWGAEINEGTLQLAHRKVCHTISLDHSDPRRLIAQELDPVNRAFLALEVDSLHGYELSAYLADALASCALGARHLFAALIVEHPALARINPAVAEQIAVLVGELECDCSIETAVACGSASLEAYQAVETVFRTTALPAEQALQMKRLLLRLWTNRHCASVADVKHVAQAFEVMIARLCARAAA